MGDLRDIPRSKELPSRAAEIDGQQEVQEMLLGKLVTHRLRCYG